MGLLKYASLNYERLTRPQHGLLKKALSLYVNKGGFKSTAETSDSDTNSCLSLTNPISFFHEFTDKFSIQKACILVPQRNIYTMLISHGFNFQTIEQSISSVDFWEGTIVDEEWVSVSDENLCSFYQLFSDNDKIDLASLLFKRLITPEKLECILMITSSNDSFPSTEELDIAISSFLPKIDSVSKLFPIGQFGIPNDTKDEIENKISDGLNSSSTGYLFILSFNDILNLLPKSFYPADKLLLYTEIFRLIQNHIGNTNICYAPSNREIKLVLFTNDEPPVITLKNDICNILNNILTASFSNKLSLFTAGCCSKHNGILEFLFQDE